MECSCVPCDECDGSGSVWVSFGGKYLGRNRCDDMDRLETCEECRGSGFSEMCDYCYNLEEDAEWEAVEHGVHPTGLNVRQKEEVEQIVKSVIEKGSM